MKDRDFWFEANRRSWDARTPVHVRSRFYDVPAFEAGGSSLTAMEIEQVGDVAGRSLLHLQCHFGLDTLSFARLGARVTGIDFSGAAINEARALAARTGLGARARFVCANVYDARAALGGETFDLVFASFGALCWLPDLDAWARVVAASLAPGGALQLIEFHPVVSMLDERFESIAFPYDGGGQPLRFEETGTYADRDAAVGGATFEWNHGLGTVVSAALGAGLVLERLREHDFAPSAPFPGMVEVAPGRFRFERFGSNLPLAYGLTARKPA